MPAFTRPVMAPLHDKVTLIGSANELTQTGELETWEWDGSSWQQHTPLLRPTARLLPGLARRGDALIMFGGFSRANRPLPNAETWQWDGGSWQRLSENFAPPARYAPSLTSVDSRILMFGGQGDYTGLHDTWIWNGNWNQWADAGGPEHCMSPVATFRRRVIMFCEGSDPSDHEGHTWEWDGGYWTEKQTLTRPSSRHAHVLASFGDRVVMYGGFADSGNRQETWEWDGNNWHERSVTPSPPPRDGYQLAQQQDRLVLYGGGDGDTWTWDGAEWSIAARSAMPAQRKEYAIGTLGERAILFGGCCKNAGAGPAQAWEDTWAWDGQAWTELHPSKRPPPRAAAKLAALGGKLVLFGGRGGGQVLDDTWEFDGTTWQERTPTARPRARQRHAMAAYGRSVYLFGGSASVAVSRASALGDMWKWDGSQWQQVFSDEPLGTLPEPSYNVALSSFGTQLVLFTELSRISVWDGRAWTVHEDDPAEVPFIVPESIVELPRAEAESPRLLVTGKGYGPYTSSEWDGSTWSGSIGLSVAMGPVAAVGETAVSLGGWPFRTWTYVRR
ncbi:MAG TPA: kelch repeat-containing protein [Polyangiales bacterium]|nr:kelch repeat-containing protein [Polyangiales bacterium]